MVVTHIKTVLLGSCAAAALAMGAAGDARAAVTPTTIIYAGGSTLAQKVYPQIFSAVTQLIDPTTGYDYAAVGSGAGQRGLLCNDPAQMNYTTGTTIAIGASDATLSQSQYTAWQNSANSATGTSSCVGSVANNTGTGQKQGGPLIQLPTFGTPVTIPFNFPSQRFSGQVQFTDAQLCQIFSGKVNNWSQLSSFVTKGAAPTGTITVAYRLDGSGTTFLLTQHLTQVCNGTGNVPNGFSFTAVQTFASLFTSVPSNFVGATGSGGVSSTIGISAANNGGTLTGTSGAVGYLSPDFTTIAPQNNGASSQFPPVASVMNSSGTYELPTVGNTNAALAGAAAPADPTNPLDWVPAVPNPTAASAYPIAGFTTMLFPTCYANVNNFYGVQEFLSAMYTDLNYANVIEDNGFSPLPSVLLSAINKYILNPNSNNLDMEDANICQVDANGNSHPGNLYPGR